jgi:2-aminoethylphosphonate-pyruvate transaminase
MVHSETTTGILNPIQEVAEAVKTHRPGTVIIADCVSSFGAVSIDFSSLDFIVTCSNKLIQGVPGLALVIARKEVLEKCEGNAKSAFLDLLQIEKSGKNFVTMPPFQSVVALQQALNEFFDEGGLEAREKRYQNNLKVLKRGMEELGFRYYIRPEDQGWIISTFIEPKHPNYDFKKLYQFLVDRGIVIYPGKLSKFPTFRIGTIGELHESDMKSCIQHIRDAFEFMKIQMPLNESCY